MAAAFTVGADMEFGRPDGRGGAVDEAVVVDFDSWNDRCFSSIPVSVRWRIQIVSGRGRDGKCVEFGHTL